MVTNAVLLAGGKSSRMGQEKGLVNFRGKPMRWSVSLKSLKVFITEFLKISHKGKRFYRRICFLLTRAEMIPETLF